MSADPTLALSVFAAWVVIVPASFAVFGPRRAAPIALFAGFLLLSPYQTMLARETIPIDPRTTCGAALLLGIVLVDGRSLARWRPSPWDLPMLAYVVLDPLI